MKMRIFEEVNEEWLYMQLHMFKKGIVSEKNVQNSDDLIYDVKKNGIITIKFQDDDDYFKLFDHELSRDDIFIANQVFSSYRQMNLFDEYRAQDDWFQGYLIGYFDDENMNKVYEIARIISPDLTFEMNDDNEKFSKILHDFFDREVIYIIDEFTSLMESATEDEMKTLIREDICDVFRDYGIYNSDFCFYRYHTTVDNLIKLYDSFGEKNKSLSKLLNKVAESISISGDYWSEYNDMSYEVDFDTEAFNNYVSNKLDDILEKLEEDSEMFLDINEFKKIVKKITNNFRFNVWYELPKDSKIKFKIFNIDPKTNKVVFEVHSKKKFYKNSLDLENFYLFLYHPEIKFED